MTVEQQPTENQVQQSENTPEVEQSTDIRNNIDTSDTQVNEQVEEQSTTKQDKDNTSESDSKSTLSQVESLLKEAGLNASTIAKEFTDNEGKLSLASMKALVEKHGEVVTNLLVSQLEGLHKTSVAKAKERDQAVFNQVEEAFKGITKQKGEQTWTELAGWAKTNLPTEDRSEINKMLGSGGLSAKLAVDYLVNQFKASEDFTQPAELLNGDGVSTDFSQGAIDKKTYMTELNKLLEAGHDYNTSHEIRKLEQRRMKGMQRGI